MTGWLKRSCLILIFFIATAAWANDAVFLALQGDGAASVVIDDDSHRAFVIDGGSGGVKGFMGATVGDSDPLGHLLARDVRELFVICSHPHRDHMSGLVSLVEDPRIAQLERIVFIDNDYEQRTGRESLLTTYRKRALDGGGGSDDPDPDYLVVQGKLPVEPDSGSGGMSIELFGGTEGLDEHDRAIISAYTIQEGDETNTVVDFDDASKGLIEDWSHKTDLKPKTLVISHHGSKYNYRTDVLDAYPSVRDVVIPVNDANRYFHPSPEVLLDLVRRLGPEHVFITRSKPGANVRAVAAGVTADGDNVARLRSFVALQLDRHEAKLERLYEIADAKLTKIDARIAEQASNPGLALIDLLVEKGHMKPQLGGRFKRSVTAMPLLVAVHDHITHGSSNEEWLNGSAYNYASVPDRMPESNNGTAGYFTKQTELREAAFGNGPASGGVSSASGVSSGDSRMSSQGPIGSGSGIMFRTALARPSPIFGGIILGNGGSTPGPDSLVFVEETTSDGEDLLTIQVTMQDGRIGEYANFTSGELWSAYQFVQPTSEYLKSYPQATSNSAGLVGINGKFDDGWEFVLHPAIADTAFATAAMRVDMLFAALSSEENPPDYAKDLPSLSLITRSWQWFDASALFVLDGERLVIRAIEKPEGCLMRVRVIDAKAPPWFDPEDEEGSIGRERDRRFESALSSLFREINPEIDPPVSLDNDVLEEWLSKATEGASAEELQVLAGSLFMKILLLPLELEAEIEKQVPVSDAERMTPYIDDICRSYAPLRKINRLAKLVALLNWYQGAAERHLPDLPEGVKPSIRTVPNWYPFDAVL